MALHPLIAIEIKPQAEMTILEAVQSAHNVRTGFVCVADKDIECVDGVCNNRPAKRFWTIEVNGEFDSVNSQSIVHPLDHLVLKYASSKG